MTSTLSANHVSPLAPIIVGVDGTDEALEATRWAAHTAQREHKPLRVVCAYGTPADAGCGTTTVADDVINTEIATAQRVVDDATHIATTHTTDVDVDGAAVHGHPAAVLREASHIASLIVVGTRHLGGIRRFLGSISAHTAAHAHCPVTVVAGPGTPTGPVVVATDLTPTTDPAITEGFRHAATLHTHLLVVYLYTTPTTPSTSPPPTTRTPDPCPHNYSPPTTTTPPLTSTKSWPSATPPNTSSPPPPPPNYLSSDTTPRHTPPTPPRTHHQRNTPQSPLPRRNHQHPKR